jgi:NAD(P)-dependent dehydrogenase (short-subunit alcohol dehydrogenase family)
MFTILPDSIEMREEGGMGDFKERVAIVTGGGTGIGRALALALAKEGAKVIICGRREAPLKEVVDTIASGGLEARWVQADVSCEEDVERVVRETTACFGTVDILINNAGISGGGRIHEHRVDEWDQVLAVNLRGPFLMARAVLPMMREHGRGDIVNISSESGLEYYEGSGAYGVSKHALIALSEYIQRENQSLGIRVHTICPGMVVTEMSQGSPGLNEAKCLNPEDVASLVIWLLSRWENIKIGRPVLIQTMENPWE